MPGHQVVDRLLDRFVLEVAVRPDDAPLSGLSVSPFAEPVPGPQSVTMPSELSAPVVSAVVPLAPAPGLKTKTYF